MKEEVERSRVILIDDEIEIRKAWSETLRLEGFDVLTLSDATHVAEHVDRDWRGVVVTDLMMPGMDGFAALAALHAVDPEIPVLIVTGHGDIPLAISAVRKGAYDFIEKPANPQVLLNAAASALEKRALTLENRRLTCGSSQTVDLERRLIGRDPAMHRLRDQIRTLASADVNVVIYGETGAGKEVVARALHDCGRRGNKPFVALNCGAIPEALISSELFGHEPGAFTGAQKRRIGKIEEANGGTLFLDEIESMPPHLQVQLLRVLQEREIERLGSSTPIPLDLRVLAAAKVDLEAASQAGSFRTDLYYRLAVASVAIPPLRARRGDVALIFTHYVGKMFERHGLAPRPVPEERLAALAERDWRGNVRELVNAAERFALGLDIPGMPIGEREEHELGLSARMSSYERRMLSEALRHNAGNVTETARQLKVPRKKLFLRMQRYGLVRDDFLDAELNAD